MPIDENKVAVLEDRMLRMAEEMGLVKRKQDDFQAWIHEHEKKELSHHNEIMTAITGISSTVELIKIDNEKAQERGNSISAKRKDLFDRLLRIALALVVLAGALNQAYNWILSTGRGP